MALKQHESGFITWDLRYLIVKKTTYCDDHERDDVVEYSGKSIRKLIAFGCLYKDNALTPKAAASLLTDHESHSANKIIVKFS